MTKQRIKRIQAKIQNSRTRLMNTFPFFAIMLMYLKFVAVTEMKQISINGKCIFFSPDYMERLHDSEVDYILSHLVMHIVKEDIWRPERYCGDDFHLACNVANNVELLKMGIGREKFPHLGQVWNRIPWKQESVGQRNAYELYENLEFSMRQFDERMRAKYLPDNDLWWDFKDNNGSGGVLILDIEEEDGVVQAITQSENLQAIWKERTVMARGIAKKMSAKGLRLWPDKGEGEEGKGDLDEYIERALKKYKNPRIDWRKLLNEFLQEEICDYSFAPPDRRYGESDFFLPDFNEKDAVIKDILFMVDTSGSVDIDFLTLAFSEIKSVVEQFQGKVQGKLGFFSTSIIPPIPFESVEDITKIIPYGGGGTSFHAIFEFIQTKMKWELPSYVVIFTDGYADFPEESEAMNIPVLWLIVGTDVQPPWGNVARIEMKEGTSYYGI